ncbi:MAG: hypothetical protein AAF720_11275 [Pseudomonadota bacterium]
MGLYRISLVRFLRIQRTKALHCALALRLWAKVRWQSAGMVNNGCIMAVAFGNYFFTPANGDPETKVEYTIAYIKDPKGDLKILVHQSSLPYSGS